MLYWRRGYLAATKVKMSGSEKKKADRNTCYISSIKRVTRKFLELLRGNQHKNVQKHVLYVQ